jgi:hypothetical protein
LRIENTARTSSVSGRSGVSRSGGGGFFFDEGAPTAQSAAAAPIAQTTGIDALLALQSVEDPVVGRRKRAIKRGTAVLDTLDTIKADLLLGQVSEGRLGQLMALITQARERNLPELDGVLDDIELRARVELAKFGRYPD